VHEEHIAPAVRIYWILTSCRLVVGYHCFWETYCLHPQ